jgi:hypothetical protein
LFSVKTITTSPIFPSKTFSNTEKLEKTNFTKKPSVILENLKKMSLKTCTNTGNLTFFSKNL